MQNSIYAIRKELDQYTSALADVLSDWENKSPSLWNMDFSVLYPYSWFPVKSLSNYTDKISYSMMKNMENLTNDTFFNLVMSRSALFELLISIHKELERLRTIRVSDSFGSIKRSDLPAFLKDNPRLSGPETANKIAGLHKLLPSGKQSHNIQNIVQFLLDGKIVSFHDILNKDEIIKLRTKINELSAFIRKYHYKRGAHFSNFSELHELIDCRNIATSMVLSAHFNETNIGFVGPSHQIRTPEFKAVHRSFMVPAFSMYALSITKNATEAKNYIERLLEKFNSVSRDIQKYTKLNNIPRYLLHDIQDLYRVVSDMAHTSTPNSAKTLQEMREDIEAFALNKKDIRNVVHDEEDKLREQAKIIISERDINSGLLYDLGCEENPRAKKILARFSS